MEDSLISKDYHISEQGILIIEGKELTPCLNSVVVMDWLEAIGGPPLVEHIYRVYAKDMETQTLGSLQSRISKNLDSLLTEIHELEQAKINRVYSKPVPRFSQKQRHNKHNF